MLQTSCEFSGAVLEQTGMDDFLSFKKPPSSLKPGEM